MDTWNLMQHWNLVIPPSRPSALQLNRIRLRIREIPRNLPVAVLGSTPEFRDLLHECKFEYIYVFERNRTFYEAMTNARIYRNVETLISGCWLETLPQFKGRFVTILSDLTSGNIPYEERPRFYHGISESLMEGGTFHDKVLTHSGSFPAVDSLIEKYSALPLNLLHINHFSSEMLFCSELLRLNALVDTSLFYRILDQRIKNERVRAFAEHAKEITPLDCTWWYGRAWSTLQLDYCSDLKQIDEIEDEPGSPYFGFLKFFEFAKRQ